jgi:hypothetical protein
VRSFLDERLAIPHEVIAPRARLRLGATIDERQIDALGLTADELLLQRLLRSRILGKDDET